ncbi:serine-rich adhesin for platelets isoform X2 [Nilaparvata lugens]|uniref:serine-rich adhesin for platelets isoform X2 n=1 Tax=Nilaparvata lugens TaxID=108931 RepID=UPI00193C8FEA|nr:serine-rich adhesin for platelets isoform X2 [Nilaparvata lugens]
MYSQLKTEQSSNGVEKPWSMDMITRRSKRRSSILGKGRTSVRLSIASTVSSVVETSPAKNEVTKTRAAGAARKPIADDVLRHFARTNGINPLNPFANQLKESVGSGQSLDENDLGSTSCSAPSSSSEGSARKEDPDITGVFFMDDVESVKKRQQLDSASSLGDAEMGASQPPSHHHLVPCNLMTKEPFRDTFKDKDTFKEPFRDTFKDKDTFKEPLKDQSVRLNRRGVTTSSASKRRTMGASDKPTRDYSSTRQPVLSPVEPILRSSSSLSLSSSLSASLRAATEPEPTSDIRRSLSTTDLTNGIAATATASSRDALRAASEMQFEEMCKTRCESVAPLSGDLFVSKKSSTNVRSDSQDRNIHRVRSSDSSALDQMGADRQDRQSRRSSALDQMGADRQDRQSRRSSALDQMGVDTQDRKSHRVRSSDSTALDQMGGHTQDRSSTKVRSSDLTTLNQMDSHSHKTHLDSRSTGKSKGRYSVALHTSDSNENHTKKSRPSVMSDLIINHKDKYDDDIFSKKDKDNKKFSDEKESSVADVLSRSKHIDDLLKRIDLSVKANRHTDDDLTETRNIDGSSSKIVNDKMETRGTVEERSTSIFLNDSVVGIAERSFSVNDREVVGNRVGSSKVMNDLNGGSDEKEVCSKFDRTLNFEDCDNNDEDDDGDRTFVSNESACNNTSLVNGYTSAGKIKKLSLIEEEEELRSRMSSASANENDNTSLLESTIRGGNISDGSTDLGGKIGDKMAAILDCLKESQRVFTRKQAEFVEQLKREQDEFVRRQNEKIAGFDRFATSFQQEQATTLAALCEDVANLVAGNSSDDDVFHTAMKKPLNVETKDSSAIYSSLKSDFKCLKTPNARVNKKTANLNKTILTPHSMSVCVQEQVSMLFDS